MCGHKQCDAHGVSSFMKYQDKERERERDHVTRQSHPWENENRLKAAGGGQNLHNWWEFSSETTPPVKILVYFLFCSCWGLIIFTIHCYRSSFHLLFTVTSWNGLMKMWPWRSVESGHTWSKFCLTPWKRCRAHFSSVTHQPAEFTGSC